MKLKNVMKSGYLEHWQIYVQKTFGIICKLRVNL